jgi:hypothetical protein
MPLNSNPSDDYAPYPIPMLAKRATFRPYGEAARSDLAPPPHLV